MEPGQVLDLSDARLKLQHVTSKADRVLGSVDEWLESNRETLIAPVAGEWVEESSAFRFVARAATTPAPAHWALEVGEVVAGLRSVLDYCAWAMVAAGDAPEAAADDRARNIQFPIVTGPSAKGRPAEAVFRDAAARNLPGARSSHLDVVREYQPFLAGDFAPQHGLGALQSASNHEKHRTLHILTLGEPGLVLPTPVASMIVTVTDAEFLVGESTDASVSGRMSEHGTLDGIVYELGAERRGPNPAATARIPTNLTAVVTTHGGMHLSELLMLVIETTSDVVDQLQR